MRAKCRAILAILPIVFITAAPHAFGQDNSAATPLAPEREHALEPKDTFKECERCPEMVVVRAGSFSMGSAENEKGRDEDEGPQHTVTFARAFAAGKFAVTFDEWDACVADGGCNNYAPGDNGWGRGKRPVINVSWRDAKAYAEWLSAKTGKQYRLLSEAEREYITRAGTTTSFWFGTTISARQANFDYTAIGAPAGSNRTVPVDAFLPNPFGLYQVHGNVWEWLEDCWNENYQGAPTDGASRSGGDCTRHAIRGGSWVDDPEILRSAYRNWSQTEDRDDDVGFRVARNLM
jgi:formylglycine-generating enzyme required for sulfatase activity